MIGIAMIEEITVQPSTSMLFCPTFESVELDQRRKLATAITTMIAITTFI